jgi:hypothetical protein
MRLDGNRQGPVNRQGARAQQNWRENHDWLVLHGAGSCVHGFGDVSGENETRDIGWPFTISRVVSVV